MQRSGFSTGLSADEKLARLRLIRTDSIGPITFRHLIQRYSSAAAALDAVPDLARRGGRRKPLRVPNRAAVERELEALDDFGGQFLFLDSANYPSVLAAVEDAPPVIAIKGHSSLLERQTIAIVGARNASAIGKRFARQLAEDLANERVTVISGLARGIDAAAHEGALGGGTVAVLAGGIDIVYPKENEALYQDIAHRGALISEVPFGTQPQARHFPRRNRIISGLAMGVVVVEAALRSGSLITARMAGEQGRDVFAVPGSPMDPRAQGANALLRDGAFLVESAADVLEVLANSPGPLSEPEKARSFSHLSARPDTGNWDRQRELVRNQLTAAPISLDQLCRECELTPGTLLTIVLELELAEIAVRHPGNRISLA